MSIKRTFNGRTIIKPGAYSKIVVENLTGFPLQSTGTVGIIGQGAGGEPRVLDILSREGIQDAKARYKSGPIADALELLVNPSKDSRLPNGASKIVVYKVNNSLQSALSLKNAASAALVNLQSKNYGFDENQVNVLLSQGSVVDADAAILGTIDGPFTLAGGETLLLKANNVDYVYTGTLTGSATAAALMAELNNSARWAGSKPVIASLVGQKITLTLDPNVVGASLDYGCLKLDANSTLDTILGMSGESRGVKGGRIMTVKKGVASAVTLELGGAPQISIKYVGSGTAAALNLHVVSNELRLQTTIAGAAGDNLDILLVDSDGKNKQTIQSLADLIASNAAYQCSAVGLNVNMNAGRLDTYLNLDIRNVAAALHSDVQDLVDYLNAFSDLLVAAKVPGVAGALASFSSPKFLTGATDGAMTNSDWADAFEAMKEERVNVVVPLISQDIGAVSIDSVNQLALNHALWGWATDGKSERSAFTSKLGTKLEFKNACRNQNSGLVSCFGQDIRVLDRNSELQWMEPWALACVAAGMRCGAEVGEPLTFKIINVNDLRVRDGSWNPKKDYAEMIDAGATIAEAMDTGGFRFVLGNTTYGVDASFVWNRESVVQAAGYLAYDLRQNLELVFTGQKARTGTAEAMANFIKARMSVYLENDITVGDDLNKGLGYKDLRVVINGDAATINVCVTPVQGIDFILPTIYLADIRQTA